jgi:hypothetical protein
MCQEHGPEEITETLDEIPDEEDLIAPVKTFRRRMVIRYVSQLPPDTVVEIQKVATTIAALENDIPIHEVATSEYSRAYSGIAERDTKRLSILGVLDKPDKSSVTRGERFDFYAAMLDDLDEFLFNQSERRQVDF